LAKPVWRSIRSSFARVEEISGQDVGFRAKGTLEALFSRDSARELSTHVALYHGWGLRAEAISAEDARELEPAVSPEVEAAVLRPDEASVDNRALTQAVLEAARKSGAEIFARREVRGIWRERHHCAGLLLENEKISAKWTIIAAGSFSASIAGVDTYAPVRPAKGQMVSLRAERLKIERVLWSDKIYLVPRNDGRILAGATVEYIGFDKKVTAGALEKILSGAIELAPDLAHARVEETWAGLRPDSPDHLPILGPADIRGLLIANRPLPQRHFAHAHYRETHSRMGDRAAASRSTGSASAPCALSKLAEKQLHKKVKRRNYSGRAGGGVIGEKSPTCLY